MELRSDVNESQPKASFLFLSLPLEIQLIIWKYVFPRGVVHIHRNAWKPGSPFRHWVCNATSSDERAEEI